MISPQMMELIRNGGGTIKIRVGKYYKPVELKLVNGLFRWKYGFSREINSIIKTQFEGYKYDPNIKKWFTPLTERNLFRLEALQGNKGPKPYSCWDNQQDFSEKIIKYSKSRGIEPYTHQVEMINLGLNNQRVMLAADMGLGKTLAAMLTAEMFVKETWTKSDLFTTMFDFIWVGPKAPLAAVKLEFDLWKSPLKPRFFTYPGLTKYISQEGNQVPLIFVIDESSCCKNEKSRRTQACIEVAKEMRTRRGDECLILELTGTPAPKTPTDWKAQCEILQPGYLAENNIYALQDKLGHYIQQEGPAGSFRKLYTWKDSEEKCKHCGAVKDHPNHKGMDFAKFLVQGAEHDGQTYETHSFVPGVNEIAKFGKRLRGLVQVWKKKDCTDLPDKVYKIIEIEPSQDTLNLARSILNNTIRAADALVHLRMLSDGFQYIDTPTGKYSTCKGCQGEGKVKQFKNIFCAPCKNEPVTGCPNCKVEAFAETCQLCKGEGEIETTTRTIKQFDCPKVSVLEQLIGEHDEVGRLNVFGGFTGTIERIVETFHRNGWDTFRIDGSKGWVWTKKDGEVLLLDPKEMLKRYQNGIDRRVGFVGQPGAAGMGLTLTAAPTTFFYSNTFNSQDRFQAEDRGHRIGMDVVRGGRIIDVIHLPSDEKVLTALIQRSDIQNLTMHQLKNLYKGK